MTCEICGGKGWIASHADDESPSAFGGIIDVPSK